MIPIKNIYYMLSYAFQSLQSNGFKHLSTEKFHNSADLCSAILIQGVSNLIRQGLGREYREEIETTSCPRGKINFSTSIKQNTLAYHRLVYHYDDFSVNTYFNRILKTTMSLLVRSDIDIQRKKELKNLLLFFDGVSTLDYHRINWSSHFNRLNRTYQLLISICELVIKGLLPTTTAGETKFLDIFDEQHMHHLYEKFILAYYRKEHPEVHSSASLINWALDDQNTTFLPTMKSDIMLKYGQNILIIDAKYYSHTLQSQYDHYSVHSGNLYQIFTYVKNQALSTPNYQVSGTLLYAQTTSNVQPDTIYSMSGNRIGVRTLNLNCDFSEIRAQLDHLAANFLNL